MAHFHKNTKVDIPSRAERLRLQNISAWVSRCTRQGVIGKIYQRILIYVVLRSLLAHGIITALIRADPPIGEPRFIRYITRDAYHNGATGTATFSTEEASAAALAEALERSIWRNDTDYFEQPVCASIVSMQDLEYTAPERFVDISPVRRNTDALLRLPHDATYTWIRAESLTKGSNAVYVPAQIVSKAYNRAPDEPIIRYPSTTGLATAPRRDQALLRGALEIIERDAFMITWLNQITPPRVNTDHLVGENTKLGSLIASCRESRLRIDIVRLITNAPAYALAAIVRSERDADIIRFSIGMAAHRNASAAAEKALREALHMRLSTIARVHRAPEISSIERSNIKNWERLLYWNTERRYERLAPLAEGPLQPLRTEAWDADSEHDHLRRIVQWCSDCGYECCSVSLTHAKKNLTPWAIEFVLIPEMQPMHLNESRQYVDGARLTDVPRSLGYAPRASPYMEEPHPFA